MFNFKKNINHSDIIDLIYQEGVLSFQFVFYIFIATGIGVLGFLSNSSTVIIAAMFISPLMSPIVLCSFSLAILDKQKIIQSLICLLIGLFLVIFVSCSIVYLSPISNITEEIMARTNPNLFDLLIAFLSGIGCAYSYIKKKSLAAASAAIAAALLTPLIVFGFGIAVLNFEIIKGSAFLFVTNLITVIISIFLVCKIYGFKNSHEKKMNLIELFLGMMTVMILSIPLTISLKEIVYQSYIVKIVKKSIEEYFINDLHYVNKFSISFKKNIKVDSVISVKYYDPNAEKIIQKNISEKISGDIDIKIIQVALASKKEDDSQNKLVPN